MHKKLIAVIVGALLAFGIMAPAEAQAWKPNIRGTAVCSHATGQYNVGWTVHNTHPLAQMRVIRHTLPMNQTVGGTVPRTLVQKITVRWRWPGHTRVGSATKKLVLPGKCAASTAALWVMGSGRADVAWQIGEAGDPTEVDGITLPWVYSFTPDPVSTLVIVVAQDETGSPSAQIECRVTNSGGVIVDRDIEIGAYALCSASAYVT